MTIPLPAYRRRGALLSPRARAVLIGALVGPVVGLGAGMVVAPAGIPGYVAGPFRGALADDVPASGQPPVLPPANEKPRQSRGTTGSNRAGATTSVAPTPRSEPAQSSKTFAFANCTEAEASGLVNVPPEHPRYGLHLDTAQDSDLIGCNGNDAEPAPTETPTDIPVETETPECPTNPSPDTHSSALSRCTTSPPELPPGEPSSPPSQPPSQSSG